MTIATIAGLILVAGPALFLLAHRVPLVVARRVGRRHGLLHLGSAADRALPRLQHLVIEVEHVVTTGSLVVVDIVPLDVRHKHDLRWFAGALAHGSADPVARAIARLSSLGRPVDVREGPAHELRGSVDRHPVRFRPTDVESDVDQAVGTTVRVDVDLRPMGHITVADEVRRTAHRCLSKLRDDGVEPILVSTTLSKPDLERVAELVGVAQFHPGTDAATIAATLRPATTGVLRAVPAGADASAETTLPGEAGEAGVVRCAGPSIDAALDSLRHVRSLRRSRRLGRGCAAAIVLATVPLAAAGLIVPIQASIAAGVGLLLVAAVAGLTVLAGAPAPDRD